MDANLKIQHGKDSYPQGRQLESQIIRHSTSVLEWQIKKRVFEEVLSKIKGKTEGWKAVQDNSPRS